MKIKLFSVGFAILTIVVGMVWLIPAVRAHQDPASCSSSALQEIPTVNPSTDVYDGDTLTYTVIYNNLDPDGVGGVTPCNVTEADATITLPDGTVINVLTDATLNVGDSISCPGGAGCAAGPYTYAVNHVDEDAGGNVLTNFHIEGVLHQNTRDSTTATDDDNLSTAVVHPSTILTKTPDSEQVLAGTEVLYTYTEENDGDVDLINPSVEDDICAPVVFDSGDDGDGILEPGETWTFTCSTTINETTSNVAIGHGTDPLGNDITWCENVENPSEGIFCDQDERAEARVLVVEPTTIITIDASEASVSPGDSVTLTIKEENDGDTDLTDPFVEVDNGVGTLDNTSPNFSGDDGDGILEPGEVWQWLVDVVINSATTYTTTGHGTNPFGDDVTWCENPQEPDEGDFCDQDEQASVTVEVEELSCTLTQGYWKTHSDQGPASYDSEGWGALGDFDGDATEEEEGENLPSSTQTWLQVFNTPVRGRVWYQLAHQFMAAYLNVQNGASTPADVAAALTSAEAWLVANSPETKKNSDAQGWASLLGSYNEGTIGPGHCSE